MIIALGFSPANYIHAWALLDNGYHNNRFLVHNHVKALFNIASLKQGSPSQIRKLIDTVLRNLRALNKQDKKSEQSWDTLIIYLIVTELDSSTDREWKNHKCVISLGSQSN